MTAALDYFENYADPNAEVWTCSRVGSPLPPLPGYNGPRSYFEYLQTAKKRGKHGAAFAYKTINADTLGWLIARATNTSVADLLSERIWSRLGTEREAFYTVDSTGMPFAGGGFNATLRDTARLGQMVLDGGRWGNEQIVPAAAIASIRQGGKKGDFAKAGCQLLPAGAMAACGGSATTTMAPLPRAVCMARRSGSIRRQTWSPCVLPRTPRQPTLPAI